MDVDATLAELRALVEAARTGKPGARYDAERTIELIEALDEWLSKGGFLPQAWAENCDFDAQMRDQHLRRRSRRNTAQAWARQQGEQL